MDGVGAGAIAVVVMVAGGLLVVEEAGETEEEK